VGLVGEALVQRKGGPVEWLAGLMAVARREEQAFRAHDGLPLAQRTAAERLDAALDVARAVLAAPLVRLPCEAFDPVPAELAQRGLVAIASAQRLQRRAR
jgi:hypothetical protein